MLFTPKFYNRRARKWLVQKRICRTKRWCFKLEDESIDIAAQNRLFNIFKTDDLKKALQEMYRVLKPRTISNERSYLWTRNEWNLEKRWPPESTKRKHQLRNTYKCWLMLVLELSKLEAEDRTEF
jgi:ubiquinone/menaquinone biosynthesis C-methylase UbiE